jgi:hypothetical protein
MGTLAYLAKTTAFSTIYVAVWLLVVTCPLRAQTPQVLSDDDLYGNARKAGSQKPQDYPAAMMYIYAYIQRNNLDMQQDSKHRDEVLAFYRWVRNRVFPEPGYRGSFSTSPPDLPPRSKAPTHPGYPPVGTKQIAAQAKEFKPTTYYMETTTDGNGSFGVPHGLPATDTSEGLKIVGAIVSVQHASSKGWYTVYATWGGSRVAWDNKNVSGIFPDPDFKNRPVRILIFAARLIN